MSNLFSIGKFSLWVVILFFVYSLGFYAGEHAIPAQTTIVGVTHKDSPDKSIDFNIFWDAWKQVEDKYVGRAALDKQAMVYGAVEGMVRSLGDPYTSFFTPEDANMLESDITGSFSGIGAEIGFKSGILAVITPLKDSPAERAGLRAGDKILKIDDLSTQDLTLEEAVRKIRGEKGTTVTLIVLRNGSEKTREFKIKRDIVKIPSLEWNMKEAGIAHLTLFNFTGDIDAEFQKAARGMLKQGVKKIVLDLRNNPGGFLDSSIDIASYFIKRGEVVAIEDFGNGKGKNEFRSKGFNYFQDMPVVVLVNEGSASASEILAGALRDTRASTIVGAKTFGKGSVQEVVDLENSTLIKITVAKWLTPSGVSIQDYGIEPDIAIKMPEDREETDKDPQLEKAFEIIKVSK